MAEAPILKQRIHRTVFWVGLYCLAGFLAFTVKLIAVEGYGGAGLFYILITALTGGLLGAGKLLQLWVASSWVPGAILLLLFLALAVWATACLWAAVQPWPG